jgi:hypothetical protein
MLLLKDSTLILLLQKLLYPIKCVHWQESKVSRLPRCVVARDVADLAGSENQGQAAFHCAERSHLNLVQKVNCYVVALALKESLA